MRAKNFVVNRGVSCFIRGVSCYIRGVSCFIRGTFRVSFVAFYRVSFVATPCFNAWFQSWSSRRERVKQLKLNTDIAIVT